MLNSISFIIPVRNRDKKRIRNCVKSLKSKYTKEIIIVDYGSKKPIKNIPNTKIIRYTKNKIWNKPHAINLGIRKASGNFIGTVDCDMIISPDFIDKTVKHLTEDSFIYSINVRRIEPKLIQKDFKEMLKNSTPWSDSQNKRYQIIHTANGGIQIYPKEWIVKIGGGDESLIYWGGMDNDIFERAIISGLSVVNLNVPILHQEHRLKKEKNLPEEERNVAMKLRIARMQYLEDKLNNREYLRNDGSWGLDIPNQNKLLDKEKELEEKMKKMESFGETDYHKAFIEAVRNNKKSFKFEGKEIQIFGR